MMTKKSDQSLSEVECRRDEAVRRALNTPPKPHSEMKVGKRKPKTSAAVSPKKA